MRSRPRPVSAAGLQGWVTILFAGILALPGTVAAMSSAALSPPLDKGAARAPQSLSSEEWAIGARQPLQRRGAMAPSDLLVASNTAMPPMFDALLALYSRLLAAAESAGDGMQLQRLKAWLSGSAAGDTDLLDVTEVLSLDLEELEILVMDADTLVGVGLKAEAVAQLTDVGSAAAKLKSALMTLPEGLQQVPDPLAIGIWSSGAGSPRVVALVMLR